jgi:hypothetical protein
MGDDWIDHGPDLSRSRAWLPVRANGAREAQGDLPFHVSGRAGRGQVRFGTSAMSLSEAKGMHDSLSPRVYLK